MRLQAAVSGWNVGIKAELTPTFGRGELFNFVSADNVRLDALEHRELESGRPGGDADQIV